MFKGELAIGVNATGSIEKNNIELRRNGPSVTIKRPEGTYTAIYFGADSVAKYPELLPKSIDGVVFGVKGGWENGWWMRRIKDLKQQTQNKELFDKLENYRIPVIFMDPNLAFNEIVNNFVDPGFKFGEAVLGAELLHGVAMDVKKNGINRRKFLKIGGMLAAAWLISPGVVDLAKEGELGDGYSADVLKLIKRVHPEGPYFKSDVRDAFVAYKMQALADRWNNDGERIKKPNLVYISDSLNVGIEDRLKDPMEKNLEFLAEKFPLFVPDISFYRTVSLGFDGNAWVTDNVYDNKKLFNLVYKQVAINWQSEVGGKTRVKKVKRIFIEPL